MSSKQQAQRTRRKARSRTIICGELKLPSSHLTTNCKIFDQRKVAFSEHDHVTRNKTSTESCEKRPTTSPRLAVTFSSNLAHQGISYWSYIYNKARRRDAVACKQQNRGAKREKNLERLSPTPAVALCVSEPQTKPSTGRSKRGRKRNYSLRANKGQASPSIATNC